MRSVDLSYAHAYHLRSHAPSSTDAMAVRNVLTATLLSVNVFVYVGSLFLQLNYIGTSRS